MIINKKQRTTFSKLTMPQPQPRHNPLPNPSHTQLKIHIFSHLPR